MTYTMKEIVEAFKNEDLSQFINSLTGEEIKNFLIEVNRYVRGLKPEEGGIYKGDRMIVAECISPKGEIQERYFDKMAEFLKSVNNRDDIATGMYYLINYLHLFQDGNGRTSRFVYKTISDRNFEDYNGKYFKHENESVKSSSRGDFCSLVGIKEIDDAKRYSGYAVYQYLLAMDLLPEELKRVNLYYAKTYIPCPENNDAYISQKAQDEGIPASEAQLVNRALKDNNESFSVGALTMLIMMKQKEKSTLDYKKNCTYHRDFNDSVATRLGIKVYGEDEGKQYSQEVLEDWSREDYIRAVKIADKVKEMLLDVNMDIFQFPNDFTCEDGETFADILKSSSSLTVPGKEGAEKLINSTVKINPDTRTYNYIAALKEIAEEEIATLLPENIGVIKLGEQTYKDEQMLEAIRKVEAIGDAEKDDIGSRR